ncbi:hypothetical protein JCM11641_006939 [Rhodosporidiobolus odoratus]
MADYPPPVPQVQDDQARSYERDPYPARDRSPPRERDDDRSYGAKASYSAPPPRKPANAPQAEPSPCLGVFGLSIRTTERDLEDEFARCGRVDKVVIVFDQRSQRSRGFGFVTMASTEEAQVAIEKMNGMDLHARRLRVDFSATQRAHEPTPGEYRGPRRPDDDRSGGRYDSRYDSRYSGGRGGGGRGWDDREDRWASRGGDRYGGGGYDSRSSYGASGYGGGGGYREPLPSRGSGEERYSSSSYSRGGGDERYGSRSGADSYGSKGEYSSRDYDRRDRERSPRREYAERERSPVRDRGDAY